MPQQRIYHEYVNDELVPYWYVLTFQPCEINWDKPVIYFDAITPFEFIERFDYDESLISMSIYLSDLILNDSIPHRLGINLMAVKKRIAKYGLDPELVTQMIIQMPEVNDVLRWLPNRRTTSLLIER